MAQSKGTDRPIVSVIAPAYKSVKTIGNCMESIFAQKTSVPYEVIVVESSLDGSGDIIRERFPQVNLFESAQRIYLGRAKNLGAQMAKGDYLLFIDSDCMANPEWIERMYGALSAGEYAGVGGAVVNGNPETAVSWAAYISEFTHFFPCGKPRNMNYLCGANCAYRADIFSTSGGFEAVEPLYVDLLLGRRLIDSGEKLLFRPDITVRHWHRDTIEEHLNHQTGRGRAAAIARRRGALPGKSLGRSKFLAMLMIPLLFARKALVFPYRFAKTFPDNKSDLARALNPFIKGMMYWHYSYLKEVMKPTETIRGSERSAECTGN